jgi:hypothetical protein
VTTLGRWWHRLWNTTARTSASCRPTSTPLPTRPTVPCGKSAGPVPLSATLCPAPRCIVALEVNTSLLVVVLVQHLPSGSAHLGRVGSRQNRVHQVHPALPLLPEQRGSFTHARAASPHRRMARGGGGQDAGGAIGGSNPCSCRSSASGASKARTTKIKSFRAGPDGVFLTSVVAGVAPHPHPRSACLQPHFGSLWKRKDSLQQQLVPVREPRRHGATAPLPPSMAASPRLPPAPQLWQVYPAQLRRYRRLGRRENYRLLAGEEPRE